MATAMRMNEMGRVVLRRHCQNDDSANCRIIEPSDRGAVTSSGRLRCRQFNLNILMHRNRTARIQFRSIRPTNYFTFSADPLRPELPCRK